MHELQESPTLPENLPEIIPPPTPQIPSPSKSEPTKDEDLISFVDMLFGGKLTSVLVCQTCKHVSQTFEDFSHLSLPLKPEDYVRERKRDAFKNFAKKFKSISEAYEVLKDEQKRAAYFELGSRAWSLRSKARSRRRFPEAKLG